MLFLYRESRRLSPARAASSRTSVHLQIGGLAWTSQQCPRLPGLLGRLGISREGHGSLAGSLTAPAGCYSAAAAGVVRAIRGGGGGGGVEEGAAKLREVEDEAMGDYLTANCTVGRPRWTSGPRPAAMPSVCYRTYMHKYMRTQPEAQSTKHTHQRRQSVCITEY